VSRSEGSTQETTKEPRERRRRRRGGSGGGAGSGGRRRSRSGSGRRKTPEGVDGTFRELVVSMEPGQTRVAIVEDGTLVEFLVERADQRRIVGDVFKGKVTAVLPGIQAAFLDIGLDKGAFLHVSDLNPDLADFDLDEEEGEASRAAPTAADRACPSRTRSRRATSCSSR